MNEPKQLNAEQARKISIKYPRENAAIKYINERIEACALEGRLRTEAFSIDEDVIDHFRDLGFGVLRPPYSNLYYLKW